MEHFRIVAIDMLGFGNSSRVSLEEEMLRNCEIADEYQVGWLDHWVNIMTLNRELPEKFFLIGHSYGGYVSSLYACRHPERISGLFLNSAVGSEAEPEDLDIMSLRYSSADEDPPSELITKFWLR